MNKNLRNEQIRQINDYFKENPQAVLSKDAQHRELRQFLTDETWDHVYSSLDNKQRDAAYNFMPAKHRSRIFNGQVSEANNEFAKKYVIDPYFVAKGAPLAAAGYIVNNTFGDGSSSWEDIFDLERQPDAFEEIGVENEYVKLVGNALLAQKLSPRSVASVANSFATKSINAQSVGAILKQQGFNASKQTNKSRYPSRKAERAAKNNNTQTNSTQTAAPVSTQTAAPAAIYLPPPAPRLSPKPSLWNKVAEAGSNVVSKTKPYIEKAPSLIDHGRGIKAAFSDAADNLSTIGGNMAKTGKDVAKNYREMGTLEKATVAGLLAATAGFSSATYDLYLDQRKGNEPLTYTDADIDEPEYIDDSVQVANDSVPSYKRDSTGVYQDSVQSKGNKAPDKVAATDDKAKDDKRSDSGSKNQTNNANTDRSNGDYSDLSFGEAFKAAREAKLKVFTWKNGKKYTTELAEKKGEKKAWTGRPDATEPLKVGPIPLIDLSSYGSSPTIKLSPRQKETGL